MKKSFFALFLGVLSLGLSIDAFAQPNPFYTGNGTLANPYLSITNSATFAAGTGAAGTTGTFATPSTGNNSNINIFTGNIITLNASNGVSYSFAIVPSPSANPQLVLEGYAEQFVQVFFPNLMINGQMASNALQIVNLDFIPFDFGLSAVLGAGALAAVRTARRRKNQNEEVVA